MRHHLVLGVDGVSKCVVRKGRIVAGEKLLVWYARVELCESSKTRASKEKNQSKTQNNEC
jgi:hypothetical protein